MSNTTSTDVALMLVQLIAITIPSTVVLVIQLRRSDNLKWRFRKLSFGLVGSCIALLITGAITVLSYFILQLQLPNTIYAGLSLVILGLLPLGAFIAVLYREHRKEFGP
jgi:H+/gluconate symporter-like permease